MMARPAFRTAFSCACAEVNNALIHNQISLKNTSGGILTLPQWQIMSESQQLEYILLLGNRGITPSVLLCIDFVEVIPYCLAIALLYLAYTGQQTNQFLDTGDKADNSLLRIAVESLLPCCPRWQGKIF